MFNVGGKKRWLRREGAVGGEVWNYFSFCSHSKCDTILRILPLLLGYFGFSWVDGPFTMPLLCVFCVWTRILLCPLCKVSINPPLILCCHFRWCWGDKVVLKRKGRSGLGFRCIENFPGHTFSTIYQFCWCSGLFPFLMTGQATTLESGPKKQERKNSLMENILPWRKNSAFKLCRMRIVRVCIQRVAGVCWRTKMLQGTDSIRRGKEGKEGGHWSERGSGTHSIVDKIPHSPRMDGSSSRIWLLILFSLLLFTN